MLHGEHLSVKAEAEIVLSPLVLESRSTRRRGWLLWAGPNFRRAVVDMCGHVSRNRGIYNSRMVFLGPADSQFNHACKFCPKPIDMHSRPYDVHYKYT